MLNYGADNFVFNHQLLNELSYKEAQQFLEHHLSLKAGAVEGDFEVIENKIMQIKLNGYEVGMPFGKVSSRAAIAQYLSITSKEMLLAIRAAITAGTHKNQVEFHSFTFSAYSAIRDLLNNERNFLMIDVSGELTDISVVSDGVLLENISFPYGENTLIRRVAASLGTVSNEAVSTLKMNQEGKLDAKAKEQIDRTLDEEKIKWLAHFKEVLANISDHYMLPESVFFLGDTTIDKYFADWIKTADFKTLTLSNNPFNFHFLDDRYFALFTGQAATATKDTFMIIESIFCDKILKAN
jgi:hypothetical protein